MLNITHNNTKKECFGLALKGLYYANDLP